MDRPRARVMDRKRGGTRVSKRERDQLYELGQGLKVLTRHLMGASHVPGWDARNLLSHVSASCRRTGLPCIGVSITVLSVDSSRVGELSHTSAIFGRVKDVVYFPATIRCISVSAGASCFS